MANDFSPGLGTAFEWNSVEYDVIQSASYDRMVEDVTAIIAGVKLGYPGPASYMFQVSLAIKKTDYALLNTLAEGETSTAALYLGGSDTGNAKLSSTEAVILKASGNVSSATYIPLDLTIRFNNLTIAAAA